MNFDFFSTPGDMANYGNMGMSAPTAMDISPGVPMAATPQATETNLPPLSQWQMLDPSWMNFMRYLQKMGGSQSPATQFGSGLGKAIGGGLFSGI